MLDKADAIQRKRWEAIRLMEEFLRSAFLDLFGEPVENLKGWEKVTLAQLAPNKGQIVDGPFGSSLKPECYVPRGVHVIRNFNIQDEYFDHSAFKYITKEKFSEIHRSEVKKDDILISTKGTIDNICKMPDLLRPSVLSASGTVRVRLPANATLRVDFLVSQMVNPYFKQYMKHFEAGTNQKCLNLTAIKKMKVIIPPLELQDKYFKVRAGSWSVVRRL
jgi:type I restriction enzyme S subunit